METQKNFSETEVAGAQSISRTIRLLQLISLHNRRGLRLTDLAELASLQKSTVHRLLKQLILSGLVLQDKKKHYHLGYFSYELGLSAARGFRMRDICEPFLQKLAMETGDIICLMGRSGTDAICLDWRQGLFPVKVLTVEVGHRQPLGVGSAGLAILSALDKTDIESVITANEAKLSSKWNLSSSRLRQLIAQTQERGYAVISDYSIPGVTGVGRAILDLTGRPIAAVGIITVSSRMDEDRQKMVSRLLKTEVAKLAAALMHGTANFL